MSGVFSAISGVFGRAMIIGALLPATLFVLFGYLVLVPMLPWEWRVVARLELVEPEWKLAVIAALSVVLAGLLDVLNIPIVRFYEGYPWRQGLLGRFLTRCQEESFDEKIARRERTRFLREKLRAVDPRDSRIEALFKIQDDINRELMAVYPGRAQLLPTRLGNVIRSFEDYPRRQYGISAVVLWPRFLSRVSEAHARQTEDARTSFNVAIHLSFLALVAALLMLAAGCIYPIPFVSGSLAGSWLVHMGTALAISWLMYAASVSRARAWGDNVRAAFDLHRAEVLGDFGISPVPRDLRSERAVWTRLSQQIIFGDEPGVAPALRFDTASMLLPVSNHLVFTRAIIPTGNETVREVRVRVENRGPRAATGVQVVETLPAGAELVWATPSHAYEGGNPYYFNVGSVNPGSSAVVSYKILLAKK